MAADVTMHPDETPRVSRKAALLFWTSIFLAGLPLNAGPLAQTPEAHAPGFHWWLIWALAVPMSASLVLELNLILWLTKRFPIGRERWRQHIGFHVAGGLALFAYYYVADRWMRGISPIALPMERTPGWLGFATSMASYAITVTLMHCFENARRYWGAQGTQLRMRATLNDTLRQRAEAELRALKAELNPHFLIQALHGVSRLMRSDRAAADRLLTQLGDLLRTAVTRATTQEVSLREEIAAFEPFLEVQRAQLGAPLSVDWDVSPDALDALVPDMILRSLAEATVHQTTDLRDGGRLHVRARRLAPSEQLELRLTGGEGPGSAARSDSTPESPVLVNARARLMELYGSDASLAMARDDGSRSVTTLVLPWHDGELERGVIELPRAPSVAKTAARTTGWRRVPAVPLLAFFVLAGVIFTRLHTRVAVGHAPDPLPIQITSAIAYAGIMVWTTIVAFRLTRAHPLFARERPARGERSALRRHLVASIGLGALVPAQSLTLAIINGVVSWHHYNGIRISAIFAGMTVCFAFFYWMMAVIAHGWSYARHFRNAQATGLLLRAQLSEAARRRAEAQLRALKTELNPHFVGNALNAISSLMRTDLAAADRMLAQVAELLRTTFARTGTQEVTLREELEQLEPFLAVERARLGHALEVRWDVDERALGGRVPHMILQPLLENAVKHGIAPRKGIGHIEVAAWRGDGRLELLVRDDGVGLADVAARRVGSRPGGVGLSNTRARLTELYGGAASLELSQDTAGGAIARLSIPWREFDASNAISA